MNNNNLNQRNKPNRYYYSQLVSPLNPMNPTDSYLDSTPTYTPFACHPYDISTPGSSGVNSDFNASKNDKKKMSPQTDTAMSVSPCTRERSPLEQLEYQRDKQQTCISSKSYKGRKNLRSTPYPLETTKNNEPIEEDEEKIRSKNLERNRLAASKCRQRKKEWLDKLAHKAEKMSRENEHLRQLLLELKEETVYLKAQLMMHENRCAQHPTVYTQAKNQNPQIRSYFQNMIFGSHYI